MQQRDREHSGGRGGAGAIAAALATLVVLAWSAGGAAADPAPDRRPNADPTPIAPAADAAFTVDHFGEPRSLELDPTRVALLGVRDAWVAGAVLDRHGADRTALRPAAVDGWSFADLDGARRGGDRGANGALTAAGVERLVEDLAASNAAAFVSPVFLGSDGGPVIPTPHILAGFEKGLPEHEAGATVRAAAAGRVVARTRSGGVWTLDPGARHGFDVLDRANGLARRPGVRFAEPDMIFTGAPALTPNDPGFGSLWAHVNTGQFSGVPDEDMDSDEAWDVTTGAPGIITVVIDTGVDQGHPDLNQLGGADFTSDPSSDGGPVNSFDNHGTAVAGCVAARINNNLGAVGVAPGTRVASARAMITVNSNGDWTSQSSWTVNALDWAEQIGARVTNNSNRYGFTSSAIAAAYSQTRAAGLVHFASAGNESASSVGYPASLADVVGVGAVRSSGILASFSNTGPGVELTAPGVSIYSTDRVAGGYVSGDYAFVSGTSFASPYAAGVAALVLSQSPQFTPDEVEQILFDSARDKGAPGYDESFGWGFVNAAAALATLPGAPGPFTLELPADGAVVNDFEPLLLWSESENAAWYEVTLATDPSFNTTAWTTTTSGGVLSTRPTDGVLDPDATYYWRVRATNALGERFSDTRSFTAPPPPPPGSFDLVAPADGAEDVPVETLLEWTPAERATRYTVVVATDITLNNLVWADSDVPGGATQYTLLAGILEPGTRYYWRIEARNGSGSTTGTPSVSDFVTELDGEPCVGDTGTDGATTVDDFFILANFFGVTPAFRMQGDLNGDFVVDVSDFFILAGDFGCTPD